MKPISCFKAYDVRGKLGEQLNEDVAYRIGRAFGQYLQAKHVVVGGDIRLSTESLKQALAKGLMDAGVNVTDIGLCGTEEIYFATSHLKQDGGIMVTASHNPIDYNGLKLVREDSKPISGDTGLFDIQRIAESEDFVNVDTKGQHQKVNNLAAFVEHVLGYIDLAKLTPKKLVVNAGNGAAGHVIDAIEKVFQQKQVPVSFIKVHHEPDGTFPNGIPNPLLPENRASTAKAVAQHQADLGIAWDGDFDRCFLFDEKGQFIEGYYIVGLLAQAFLEKAPGSRIIHDPRLTFNTLDIVAEKQGIAVQSKTGHAFIKERMRAENAIYGGEMSAHHYFRDFFYCDSGMIPWLLITELLCIEDTKLSDMLNARIAKYPSSGEINRKVSNAPHVLTEVEKQFGDKAIKKEEDDGLTLIFEQWRLNVRSSNTEPLLRVNIEARGDEALMQRKTEQVLALIDSFSED